MDRNLFRLVYVLQGSVSLSARRAWIEIVITAMTSQISVVALRKESVDRNRISRLPRFGTARSLSARRAWIEIGINSS